MEIKAVVSLEFATGIEIYANECDVTVLKVTGLNENSAEVIVSGGRENLVKLNDLASNYNFTQV